MLHLARRRFLPSRHAGFLDGRVDERLPFPRAVQPDVRRLPVSELCEVGCESVEDPLQLPASLTALAAGLRRCAESLLGERCRGMRSRVDCGDELVDLEPRALSQARQRVEPAREVAARSEDTEAAQASASCILSMFVCLCLCFFASASCPASVFFAFAFVFTRFPSCTDMNPPGAPREAPQAPCHSASSSEGKPPSLNQSEPRQRTTPPVSVRNGLTPPVVPPRGNRTISMRRFVANSCRFKLT